MPDMEDVPGASSSQVDQLRTAVLDLSAKADELADRADVNRAAIELNREVTNRVSLTVKVAGAGLALALIAIIALAFVAWEQKQNTDDIESVTTRTSDDVLCPVYRIFLDSVSANPAPANQPAEAIAFRQKAIGILENSYRKLDCPQ